MAMWLSTSWPWPSLLLVIIISMSSLSLLFLLHSRHQKSKGLPPGPSGLVFVAKFLALRQSILGLGPVLRELHTTHGPVVSISLLGTRVFVADRRVAHSVLVQGGASFSDRPPFPDPSGLFHSGSRVISSSSYGAYWRVVRRNLATEVMHPSRVLQFAPARQSARDALLRDLLGGGGGGEVEVRPAFRRALFQLLVQMNLGASWLSREALDEVQELQLRVVRSMTSFPVFSLPLSKWLFRQRWERHVAVRRRLEEIFLPLIHARRERQDRPSECYADSLLALRLAEEGGRPLTDAEMVSLCTEFFNGGADTTVTTLEWIMAELVNRPDVQSKLYQEVKACRPEDLQSMPYLKAVVLEGLRLHPPTHFLIPHAVHKDGAEIGGYAVPKGAEVYFMVADDYGRDETVWAAPWEFRPERFLEGGEGHDVDITGTREIKMMPFGAGRRMCPAYRAGMLHLEYFVASLVSELEWLPATDLQGDQEVPDMAEELDFTTVMKHPLRARIVPRT